MFTNNTEQLIVNYCSLVLKNEPTRTINRYSSKNIYINDSICTTGNTQSQSQSGQAWPTPTLTPLQLEINRYNNIEITVNVDILEWWRTHEKEYPLLSRAAKKYLCIQPTSCSSERTFSTGGKTVSSVRTKLDTENVHMLVYCKENMSKLKITKWKYTDVEEEDAEEEMDVVESTEAAV